MEENKSNKQSNQNPETSSSKNLWIALGVIALLVVGAVLFMRGGDAPVDLQETQETENDGTTAESHEVVLSEQNLSGQSGTATLVDLGDGTTRVTVDAHTDEGTQSAFDDPQPAHIHAGTCEDLGGVEYPLENVVDGHSETVVNVSLGDLLDGTFAINLHQSAEQAQLYTACGNL